MRGTRLSSAMAGVVLALVAWPQAAGADVQVRLSDGSLLVDSDFGDSSARFVLEHFADSSRNGFRVRQLGFGDPAIVSDDPDCRHNPAANDVVCAPFRDSVVINLHNGPDEVVIGGSNVGCATTPGTPVLLFMRGGNDILRVGTACGGQSSPPGTNLLHPVFTNPSFPGVLGGAGNDQLSGGRLNDDMHGEDGSDTLRGEGGSDNLRGGTGNDTLDGGSGNDTLDGQGGADVMIGRSGTDTATYAARGSAVNVTLDGAANDGAAGEGDNITGVQTVLGGAGADDLTGNDGANTLEGFDGDDELEGEGGTDVLRGGSGNDLIDSRDGVTETVSCGFGFDSVIADLDDTVPLRHPFSTIGCENVERFAVDDGPPGRIRGRSVAVRRHGRVRLRLECPRRARVACRGSLRLTTAGRSRRTLVTVRYAVPVGRTRAVDLRLSRRAAVRARRAKVLVASTRERGASRKGARGTAHSLRVLRGR